jgi:hypothetical protein
MRFNLISTAALPFAGSGSMPLSLTLRPSRGLPGDYTVSTDFDRLANLLRRGTTLSKNALASFRKELQTRKCARLLAVEVTDEVLSEIGYFVD